MCTCLAYCGFAQGGLDECIKFRNANHIFIKQSCELTENQAINDIEALGYDSNDRFLLMDSIGDVTNNGTLTKRYHQIRYGYKTNRYLIITIRDGFVNYLSFDRAEGILLHDSNLKNVELMTSAINDSLIKAMQLEGAGIFKGMDKYIEGEELLFALPDAKRATSNNKNESEVRSQYLTDEDEPTTIDTIFVDNGDRTTLEYHIKFINKIDGMGYIAEVNGFTGDIKRLRKNNRYASNGSGRTLYNDVRNFQTKWIGPLAWQGFRLFDDSRGNGIHTRYLKGQDLLEVRDPNNLWYTGNSNMSKQEVKQSVSAHWAAQKAWDYFFNVFQWHSINNNGHKINIQLNTPGNNYIGGGGFDAGSNKILLGPDGSGRKAILSLDMISHEYTHGVIKFSIMGNNGFVYSGEAGALEESFSDIFGAMVEYYIEGADANWSMGDDLNSATQIRYMNAPNSSYVPPNLASGQPSWYGQPGYWFNTSGCYPSDQNDNCGVHINSGVQNHWFYLLSVGGYSSQPGNNTEVIGIGREKAALISYLALSSLHPTSNFSDSRIATIMAAIGEFGGCSFEVEQTINAWDAVNVTGEYILAYDLNYSCSDLSQNEVYAIRDLTVACNYSSEAPHKDITAGRSIRLKPGFRSNSDMHIQIEECLEGAYGKRGEFETYGGAGNQSTDVVMEEEDAVEGFTVSVYPNPNKGEFTVMGTSLVNVEVYSSLGKLINAYSPVNNTLNISGLASGVYLVRAYDINGKSVTERVVVY